MNNFNSTVLNILSNYIPHEFVECDDKNSPWFNKKIRASTQEEKNVAFKNYHNNSSNIALNVV